MRDDSDRRGIPKSNNDADFLLEFDTPSDEFYRGFQCGEIWACLVDEVPEVRAVIYAANAEMIMRMSTAANYKFEAQYLTAPDIARLELGSGEWMVVVMRSNNE